MYQRIAAQEQPVLRTPVFPDDIRAELLGKANTLRELPFHPDNDVIARKLMHGSVFQEIGARVAGPQDAQPSADNGGNDDACHRPAVSAHGLSGKKQAVDGAELSPDLLRHHLGAFGIGGLGKNICGQTRCFHGAVRVSLSICYGKEGRALGNEERIRIQGKPCSRVRGIAIDDR